MNFAPLAELQRLRSYSRLINDKKETWEETCKRTIYSEFDGIAKLGKLTPKETELVYRMQYERKGFGSSRNLWVGGTEWFSKPENYSGGFNCTSLEVVSFKIMAELMNLAMMGSGTGAVLEDRFINQIPAIRNRLLVNVVGSPGLSDSIEETTVSLSFDHAHAFIVVGDSRKGWVESYQAFLELSADERFGGNVCVVVDVSHVRPKGELLKGFGGVSNPAKLPGMFPRLAEILNGAVGRKLNSVECCLVIDEAAVVVVAGSIRRSAGMRQFEDSDTLAAEAKSNLYIQDESSNWKVDPKRQAMTMANHTRVYHHKPSRDEIKDAVTKQFYSGEGAIQYAPEAIARANADLLNTTRLKKRFIEVYEKEGREQAMHCLEPLSGTDVMSDDELNHRLNRYGLNPCGEIIFSNGHCNLASIHLNQLDPFNFDEQKDAFKASALQAAAFLQRGFVNPLHQHSRDLDPIVGVSFTGAFTFFAKAFGIDWLRWWQAGRPDTIQGLQFKAKEREYLESWKNIVEETVWEYCDSHGLKRPNRCTTLKPEGSQTLLTGVGCNGHHAPKGWRYIRRMTFRRDDPIALAAIDYGYSVIPSTADKDEHGNLLNDPFDPRCTEWLVEVPVEEEIVSLFPEAESIDSSKFSALAQFDWYMHVQKYYVTHNTSATIEFRQDEIEPLSQRIYEAIQNDEGYVSAALLARFDANETFPRMPFEPITKEKYDDLVFQVSSRRKSNDFQELFDARLAQSQQGMAEPQDSACGDGFCAIK